MKICFISNLYQPYLIGGAEKYVEEIAGHLSKENEVVIITTKPYDGLNSLKPSVETQDELKIYRFFPINVYHTYYAKKTNNLIKPFWHLIDQWNPHSYFVVKNILKREMPDVVHTHNLGGLSLSTFYAVKSLDLPLVHTIHDYSLLCPNAMLLHSSGRICKHPKYPCKVYCRLKRKFADYKPDMVSAPSQFVLDRHIKTRFFESSKTLKLPLGIELDDTKINKDYETIDILYVGQLAKHKGIPILIEAFKKIETKNVRLCIIGKGPNMEWFEKLSEGDERIKFYGFISESKLREHYEQANITVVPSIWYDNSPMVIYESFMRGTPVIGSRIGGIPELVEDGYNGFLFEPGNTEQLKTILAGLSEDSAKLEELSINAFNSAKNYEVGRHIKKLTEIYKGLMR
jgi:glycosyltransferase involved in cell wall biosynthesis